MSMTPKEAAKYICPVIPVKRTTVQVGTTYETPSMCVGPSCMWWIDDPWAMDGYGSCAINELATWAETINSTVRDS